MNILKTAPIREFLPLEEVIGANWPKRVVRLQQVEDSLGQVLTLLDKIILQ